MLRKSLSLIHHQCSRSLFLYISFSHWLPPPAFVECDTCSRHFTYNAALKHLSAHPYQNTYSFHFLNENKQKIDISTSYKSESLERLEVAIEARRKELPQAMAQFDQYWKYKLFYLSTPTHRDHVKMRLIEYLQRIAKILGISGLESAPGNGGTAAPRKIAPATFDESRSSQSSAASHHEQCIQASDSTSLTVQRSHHTNTAGGPSKPQYHSDAIPEVQVQRIKSIPCALETIESTCPSYGNPLSLQVHIA